MLHDRSCGLHGAFDLGKINICLDPFFNFIGGGHLGQIGVEQFLEMLRFDQRSKLEELPGIRK